MNNTKQSDRSTIVMDKKIRERAKHHGINISFASRKAIEDLVKFYDDREKGTVLQNVTKDKKDFADLLPLDGSDLVFNDDSDCVVR
jgi:hypothetical protein